MITRTKIVSAGVGALAMAGVVALGAGGAAMAFADPTSTPSASASASSSAAHKTPDAAKKSAHRRDLLRHTLHGELTVGGKKGTRVIDLQRGTVTTVNPTSITVKSTDGFQATYVVTGSTKVRKDGEKSAIGAVQNGDQVRVVAQRTGSTTTATLVAEPKKG